MTKIRVAIITVHNLCANVQLLLSMSYLDLHASDRFAQLEHDKDQARINRLPAAGAGLLPVVDKHGPDVNDNPIQSSFTVFLSMLCSLPLQPL